MGHPEIERRSAPRKRVLKAVKIIFPNGASVMDCTVRNVSDVGAKLTLPSAIRVLEAFTLLIDSDDVQHTCRIVRRESAAIGVQFISKPWDFEVN
ncbi:PilZ domain-containing protein [Methylobacterium sp. WL30]|uniref:PilZ domain-containing protein n=1 Tax=unclassified Methylobacterium TaxID=2615210 RepID=UPI0011CC50C9|nr:MULTISPECIES: PilZ domain-containing protein [unclassified Methylobacterium]TXM91482.1 PilZ domain-containing protein [Methylobacterium sp. WL116]TXN34536.1 PilZ domain-containing protein [Methylobacterium sp. WL93]TXN44176.1 PilZ domain-containing protein [Methylobacterium sp. WL119]TXN60912.1 PilZ domain-containing protein [Methylobacterium sp. WL30]